MFALALATVIAAGGPPAYLSSCPSEQGRTISISQPVVPDNVQPTNRRTRLYIDLGSDGSVRSTTMVESSGDAVFDAAAVDAAKRSRFAPPTQACISTSSMVPQDFGVPILNLARPAPGASGQVALPKLPTATAAAICGTPGVMLKGLDIPDARQAPGTTDVDVALDANAHGTNAKLAKSSGNAKTDATAVELAHDAQFTYVLPPGCQPKPMIYRLELTFH